MVTQPLSKALPRRRRLRRSSPSSLTAVTFLAVSTLLLSSSDYNKSPLLLTVEGLAAVVPSRPHLRPPVVMMTTTEAAVDCDGNGRGQSNDGTIMSSSLSRRSVVTATSTAVLATMVVQMTTPSAVWATTSVPSSLLSSSSPNGGVLMRTSMRYPALRWADIQTGSGQPFEPGSKVCIDYTMSTTGGGGRRIYSTAAERADVGAGGGYGTPPYEWTLGDGTTVVGLEICVLGDGGGGGIPPMLPGGIRRIIIPANLGYASLVLPSNTNTNSNANSNVDACSPGSWKIVGPIPPRGSAYGGAYERWYQQYCNPRLPYQPDLVMDVKLYGKRTV